MRQRERLAAAVALERQHRPFAARLVGAVQQDGRARLDRLGAVERRDLRLERGEEVPLLRRQRLGRRDLRDAVAGAVARRLHRQPRELRLARRRIEHERQRLGDLVPA